MDDMAMDFVFRNFRSEDLPVIKRLTVESFQDVSIDRNIEAIYGIINQHDWQWRKARQIDADVTRKCSAIFVVELASQVIGYITTWIDREGGMGFIPNLAVDADQRGNGLGRRLIEHALEHFRAQGVRHVRIETLDQNEIGPHLYPSLGFCEVARQIHYCMEIDKKP